MPAPCVFPAIRYRDADAAIRWLTEAVGFTEHALHRTPEGRVAHGEYALGTSIVMLGEAAAAAIGGDTLYVAVAEPDALHARLRAAGTRITRPPYTTDYGSREFSCEDPEGRGWSFGDYWPTVPG